MAFYKDLEAGDYKEIREVDFTDDPEMDDVWMSTVQRTDSFVGAINEHMTYIGPLPSSIREQVESNLDLAKPV